MIIRHASRGPGLATGVAAFRLPIRYVQWAKITHTNNPREFVDGLQSPYIDSEPIAVCGVAL
jgi:hypothetical protein